jgi:hypothetical protein
VNIPADRSIPDRSLTTAILTDSHFWIPIAVLIFGIVLLVLLT